MKKLLVILVCSFFVVHCGQAVQHTAPPDRLVETTEQPDGKLNGKSHGKSSGIAVPMPNTSPKAYSQEYLIGPEDVLEILVWKNVDLSRVVSVRPDGKFSLPLVGDVQAAGLTTVQLAEHIIEKLMAYYQERPHVSVIVQQVNSYVFYILGEVREPGRYTVKSGTSLLQGITLAKGFTDFASTGKIVLLRRDPDEQNKETRYIFSYKDIISNKQINILLKSGDTIIVP